MCLEKEKRYMKVASRTHLLLLRLKILNTAGQLFHFQSKLSSPGMTTSTLMVIQGLDASEL